MRISNNIVVEIIASNEPEVAVEGSTEPAVAASNEPISLPSFSKNDESDSDDESSDETIYDLDYLCHDPGRRFPIRCYNVNNHNSVIRGYIAMGLCQSKACDFPLTEISVKPRHCYLV